MRWFKRLIAAAVLSMSTALAGVGATYGQDNVVGSGFHKHGRPVPQNGKITQIRISDAARRPGT
jgi:sulfonate transport system substrate-binding protein